MLESKNENHKMALKDKLHNVKMNKDEGATSYLTCVEQVKDELETMGDIFPDSELVRIALKGFTKKWDIFVKCIVGREKLPNWSRLWDDFTWVVRSVKKWSRAWHLQQQLTRRRKTSVRSDVTTVVRWDIMPLSVLRRRK